MAIDATVGGASSNSYNTLAEADSYFADREPSTAWDDASEVDQEDALLTATKRLEQEHFRGTPVKPLTGTSSGDTQSLWFPAHEVTNRAGWTYLQTVIPEGIKRAQLEIAYAILDGQIKLVDSGLEQFDRAKVGSLEVDIRHTRKAGALPEHVRRELREFTTGGGINVPLVRG